LYLNGVYSSSNILSSLAGFSSVIINFSVNFSSGFNQNITIILDPSNLIPESNKLNNNLTISVNVTLVANVSVNAPLVANTTDVINVNGNLIGNDGTTLANKLFLIKLNNVLVSSNTYDYSNFSLGNGNNINMNSSGARLNLTSPSNNSIYLDDYSSAAYTTDSHVIARNNEGHYPPGGYLFSLDTMTSNFGNITYKFDSITQFYNASVYIRTANTDYNSPTGNTSIWYGFNNSTWTLLASSRTQGALVGGNIPVSGYSTFYIMLKSDISSGGDNPVTELNVSYSNYDYSSSGVFNSSSIYLPNLTYTILKWGREPFYYRLVKFIYHKLTKFRK
jgi:hypothetical protein